MTQTKMVCKNCFFKHFSYSGNPSTSSSLQRHHLLMNHLPGLLETEPLILSCLYGTDHIRVLNGQEKENFDLPITFPTDLNKKSGTCIDGSEQKVFVYFFIFL